MSTQLPNQRTPLVDKKGFIEWVWLQFFQQLANQQAPITPQFIALSHAARLQNALASSYPNGSICYETDRGVYYVANDGTWQFLGGVMQATQSSLPSDLDNAGDKGFLAEVTDYAHLLRWTGTGWEWGPGENGSGYSVPFVSAPSPATGWHACNGAAQVLTLLSTGKLAFATVPNTAGSYYRQ